MSTALEYMFTARKLMFTALEHKYSRCKDTFSVDFTKQLTRIWHQNKHHVYNLFSMFSHPPFASMNIHELNFCKPCVVNPICWIPVFVFLRWIFKPMSWTQASSKIVTVLLFVIRVILQCLEHLLRCNPFLFFHSFLGKGRRSAWNKQIF